MPPELSLPTRTGRAWIAGLTLFALEAAQSLLLLPLLMRWLPAREVALWVSLTAGLGLVNAVAASYGLPLMREVSRVAAAPLQLPANWQQLTMQADWCGALLLSLFQSVFVAALAVSDAAPDWPLTWWLALALYLVAMHARLVAMNRFVWLNGLGLIGLDKLLLARASALMLVAAAALAYHFGSILALSVSAALSSGALLHLSRRRVSRLGQNGGPRGVRWPTRQELLGLVALNLAGYLNLGTDVLIANYHLSSEQAVAYAFLSRFSMISVLLAGLYTQFRFPAWVRMSKAELRSELRRCLLAAGTVPALGLLVYAAGSARNIGWPFGQLESVTVFALAGTTACACAVVIGGQISTARSRSAHLVPSALLAACAPLLALGLAQSMAAQAFVGGYLIVNAALCGLNLLHARRALNESAP